MACDLNVFMLTCCHYTNQNVVKMRTSYMQKTLLHLIIISSANLFTIFGRTKALRQLLGNCSM